MSKVQAIYHPKKFGPRMADRIEKLAHSAQKRSLFQKQAKDLSERLSQGGYTDANMLCQDLLDLQRLSIIFASGQSNKKELAAKLNNAKPVQFKDFQDFPGNSYLKERYAYQLVDAFQEHDSVPLLFEVGEMNKGMLPRIIKHAIKSKKPFDIRFADWGYDYSIVSEASTIGTLKASDLLTDSYRGIGRLVRLQDNGVGSLGYPLWELDKKGTKRRVGIYRAALGLEMKGMSQLNPKFTYTCVPTAADAKLEGMSYPEYSQLFLEMTDQPWTEIHQAQKSLVAELNKAKTIRFTNSDGTDLSMSIKGFEFANTHIDANVPGSEVFSAPKLDSVEGTVVAKGSFIPPGEREKVEDIRLKFKKGRVVEHFARRGEKVLHRVLNRDKNAKMVGEIAIGTNPGLTRPVHNILMVEKISGSFHFALGNSYSFKKFRGKPINVDNGNRSRLHWDITTMLAGKEGTIELDGVAIMKDGRFLDAKYDVLNRGWKAIPDSRRPAYWRQKLTDAAIHNKPPPQL